MCGVLFLEAGLLHTTFHHGDARRSSMASRVLRGVHVRASRLNPAKNPAIFQPPVRYISRYAECSYAPGIIALPAYPAYRWPAYSG